MFTLFFNFISILLTMDRNTGLNGSKKDSLDSESHPGGTLEGYKKINFRFFFGLYLTHFRLRVKQKIIWY